jgi:hypothetical protein
MNKIILLLTLISSMATGADIEPYPISEDAKKIRWMVLAITKEDSQQFWFFDEVEPCTEAAESASRFIYKEAACYPATAYYWNYPQVRKATKAH